MTAALLTDAYKLFHREASIPGMTEQYENFTSRSGKLSNIPDHLFDGVVNLGIQYYIEDILIRRWNETFFHQPKKEVCAYIQKHVNALTMSDYDISHFEELHDLQYLPLLIKALPEGVTVPYGVCPMTFRTTVKKFGWVAGYLETICSTTIWPMMTSATTSRAYLKAVMQAFDATGLPNDTIPFMVHDFSCRGMFGDQAGDMSGFAHLAAGNCGTDTISAILFAEKHYGADVEKELVGVSVPATEHSTTTTYIMYLEQEKGLTKQEAEIAYIRHLFSIRPTGIISHVFDSFDFWGNSEVILPILKEEIMRRDGKLVIRPDTGDPVKILTGYKVYTGYYSSIEGGAKFVKGGYDAVKTSKGEVFPARYYQNGVYDGVEVDTTSASISPIEVKGLIEALWDLFGGTKTSKGYKVLDEHIGAIYGDSITLQRQEQIFTRLIEKGFAPTVVLGVGSYSYQYVTRDTHGSAIKATWSKVSGVGVDVQKDPKTDPGKKSAKGLLRVELENGVYVLYDQQTEQQEKEGLLKPVFENGKLLYKTSLKEIRANVFKSLSN
jgi:nicotinamide phosphoribosyltransferase